MESRRATPLNGGRPTINRAGIVWVASYPKSGNTWLANLLYAYANGTPEEFADQTKLVARYSPLLRKQRKGEITAEQAYRRLRKLSARSERPVAWARITFAKTHCIPNELESLSQHAAGAVLIVRSPKDVLLSAINFLQLRDKLKVSPREFAERFIETGGHEAWSGAGYGTWTSHWQQWTTQLQMPVHVLSYEQLRDDTAATTQRMLEFLQIRPEPRAVAAAVEASSFESMKKRELSKRDGGHNFMNTGMTGRRLDSVEEYGLAGLDQPFDQAFGRHVAALDTMLKPDAAA